VFISFIVIDVVDRLNIISPVYIGFSLELHNYMFILFYFILFYFISIYIYPNVKIKYRKIKSRYTRFVIYSLTFGVGGYIATVVTYFSASLYSKGFIDGIVYHFQTPSLFILDLAVPFFLTFIWLSGVVNGMILFFHSEYLSNLKEKTGSETEGSPQNHA